MALISEWMQQCGKKVLDNAGIVRDACSIKGNVKENISPSTGAGKHFLGFQPPSP
jgi:hypothetical protein